VPRFYTLYRLCRSFLPLVDAGPKTNLASSYLGEYKNHITPFGAGYWPQRCSSAQRIGMNQHIRYPSIIIGVLVALLCYSAPAKQGKPGATMELVAVDLTGNNITVADATGNNPATYAVTSLTTVTINGQPAKLSGLRPGMHVFMTVIQDGKTADKIDATSSSPVSNLETKPTPSPSGPKPISRAALIDLVTSNAFWNLLNDEQRSVVQSTGRQFRNLLDSRTFDGWSAGRRAVLERRSLETLNGPHTIEYDQAISTLAALRSTNAVPALCKLAFRRGEGDNRDRWLAVRALGIIGDTSVVPDMIHLLYHRNLDTRWWAQISLVELTGQNFGKDWKAWGNWWSAQPGQPPFSPVMIHWWSGQPEPDKLAQNLDEADQHHFQNLARPQP